MSPRSNNVEIAVLQSQITDLKQQFGEARKQHREDMDKVFAKLDSLKSDIAAHVPCPAPGACIRLEQQLKSTEGKVQVLNDARQRAMGERAIIGTISGAVGALVIALIGWLIALFGK